MSEIKKILVIRLSSLGDIILSFPLINKIKQKFPESDLHFLTKENYKELLQMNPDIDKTIVLNDNLSELRSVIKEEGYDLILDIHKNYRSIFLSLYNGSKVNRYRKDNFKKFLLVKFKIDLLRNALPVYKKYLKTFNEYIDHTDHEYSTTNLKFNKERSVKENFIVIAPSSKHFTKTYPKEKFVSYINNLQKEQDIKIVLVGDDSDRDTSICKYIIDHCENVTDLSGKLSLDQLCGILYNSKKIICNDSAILHLSESIGKEVTAIFGSTVKQFGFFPQLKGSTVLEVNDLNCRPCTHIGRDKCPKGHFKCMNEIQLTVDS